VFTVTQKIIPKLNNPFAESEEMEFSAPDAVASQPGVYEETLRDAFDIINKPFTSAGLRNIQRQHLKNRMTIWERIEVLTDKPPKILFQNWGPNLDGASLVTAILDIEGRDVAVYGHDFTIRAGSMDATNGKKLARLFELAGKRRIPLIGMNDSSGAYVPAGRGWTRRLRRGFYCAA
jgi:acetyl-CoA carboxylase carboxyltransferase component